MLRPTLKDFTSIVCFKAVVTGMEGILGEKAAAIALIAAGRKRGNTVAQELGLLDFSLPLEDVAYKLRMALGKDGTCLCIVHSIIQENNVVKVYTSETFCSAGEPQGSERKCTYTLGVIWGVVEQFFGQRFQGKHTESVLRGGDYDVFEFVPM